MIVAERFKNFKLLTVDECENRPYRIENSKQQKWRQTHDHVAF